MADNSNEVTAFSRRLDEAEKRENKIEPERSGDTFLQERVVAIFGEAVPEILKKPALKFMSLRGRERIGELFEYELMVRTPDDFTISAEAGANIDLKAVLGKEMTVSVMSDQKSDSTNGKKPVVSREITGVIAKAEYVRPEGRYNVYRGMLRPWLWLATLTTKFRIFQDKTVVEIIDEVLKSYPYPVEKRLDVRRYGKLGESARNEPRAFQVQYGESDFDFIQRLMEEWGIYWFYEHADGKHLLVLCDHVNGHRKSPNSAYHQLAFQPQGGKTDAEYVMDFSLAETLCTGRYATNDFDFMRVGMDLRASSRQPRETNWNKLERYEWPGDYTDRAHGELLARTRMEELRAPGTRATGEGNLRGLSCGQIFELNGHKHDAANDKYLVIETRLELSVNPDESGSGYEYTCNNRFEVQPTSEAFRLPRLTPKPRVSGPQSAIVVGPPGNEIWTDEFGRVMVRFPWDVSPTSTSCWIRVSQAWAGEGFGGMCIPRIGQEVIVDFWNGDPDRPLITGSLYNTRTMPPWELPGNATQSGLMSRSLGGGLNNFNGIRFEDKAGSEEFMIQAEGVMNRLTKIHESHVVGANLSVGVGLTYGINVGAAHSVAVGGAYSNHVLGAASYVVGMTQSVSIGGAESTTIGGTSALSVGSVRAVTVGDSYSLNVGRGLSLVCGSSSLTMTCDGKIKLAGTEISIEGDNRVVIKGMPLELNPSDSDESSQCGNDTGSALAGCTPLVPSIPPLPPIVVPDLPVGAVIGAAAAVGAAAVDVIGVGAAVVAPIIPVPIPVPVPVPT
ncbi:type VI secretion system tip protein VgrG, partial [Burkholderia pyrrocinia]|nr:type VI secretion system tip protein VgrG [Burkholderia pyrrocinia]